MQKTRRYKRLWSTMLLLVAMLVSHGAWAADYISEIKVSVENGNSGSNAKSRLTNDGYKLVDADLNGGAGGKTDYVYIGYKTSTNVADAITGLLIVESATDFDAHAIDNITKANVIYNGKKYYRCDNYKVNDDGRLDCDLNRHNSDGADIVLYYTKEGNTSNGGTPLTSISVVGVTTATGVVYTRHWKYNTAQNGTDNIDVYGNTNQGNGTAHYITYTTHTHSLADVDYDTTNHKYWCASCGYVSAYNAHVWENTGTKVSDATCDKAEVHYQTCKYCKRTNDAKHVYDYGSTLGHKYNADGVCERDASHYQPATLTSGYYQITNYGNLCWFRNEANSGKKINAKLTTDINLSGKDWATSIGEGKEFGGIFDGQGHTITGNARKALFCVLKAGGVVRNVVSSGASSKDNYEAAGNSYQSPFVRRNYGTIENCIVKSAYWDSRNSYLGGITGVNETDGVVRNCGFYDSSLRLRNGANTQVGGIVGVNCEKGRVENCFTWGISYMNNGTLGKGGIVCENRSRAIVSNCYTNDATPVFTQDGTATDITAGISAAFITTGEMCHKLNGGITNGTQTWYQKIGTETFPNPTVKTTANTVYAITNLKCDGNIKNVIYTNSATAVATVDGHGLSGYTPTYTWGGDYTAATCSFMLRCNACNGKVVEVPNLATSIVTAAHVNAGCTKDGVEQWTATGSYSKTGDVSYTGTAQLNNYPIPMGHTFAADDPAHTHCTACDHSFFRYASNNNAVVNPSNADGLQDAKGNVIPFTNTYANGQGVIEFEAPLAIIDDGSFHGCADFTGPLNLPKTTEWIGHNAFTDCSGFTGTLSLSNIIKCINAEAFAGCGGFTAVEMASVPLIEQDAFMDVTPNRSVTLSLDDPYIYKGINPYTEVTSVKAACRLDLSGSVVANHPKLVLVHEGNAEVKDDAHFVSSTCLADTYHYSCEYCHASLAGTFTTAGTAPHTFANNNADNGVCTVCDHGFFRYEADELTTPYTPKSLQDKAGNPLQILSHTFSDSKGVMEFNAPLVTIGYSAFENCFYEQVTIPTTVKAIGSYAFENCVYLERLNVPDSVETIGSYAFANCSGLSTVFLGKSVKEIAEYAFADVGYPDIFLKSLPQFTGYGDGFLSAFHNTSHIEYPDDYPAKGASTSGTKNRIMRDEYAPIPVIYNFEDDSYVSRGHAMFNDYVRWANYTRKGIRDEWNTIVVPFPLGYGDPEVYDLYKLGGVTGDEVELIKVKEWEPVFCSTPVLLRINPELLNDDQPFEFKVTSAFSLINTKLDLIGTPEPGYSENDGYIFYGTYEWTTVDQNDYFLADGKFWHTQPYLYEHELDEIKLAPFRACLKDYNRGNKHSSLKFSTEKDDVATGVLAPLNDRDAEYYDINGRRIPSLQDGVNIVRMPDGTTKKVVIK